MIIGERLKQLRKGHGLTQEQLAEKIGVDRSTISLFEHGKSVSPAIISKVKQKYDVDVLYPTDEWFHLFNDFIKNIYRKNATFFIVPAENELAIEKQVIDKENINKIISFADSAINEVIIDIYKYFAMLDDNIYRSFLNFHLMMLGGVTISYGPKEILEALKEVSIATIKEAFLSRPEKREGIYFEEANQRVQIAYKINLDALLPEKSRIENNLLQIKEIFNQRPDLIVPVLQLLKTAIRK